jgi:glutamate-ammonia-ligase adenylyltransferase
LEKYKEYYNKRARIWELQSFLKARLVCGDNKLFDELVKSFLKRVLNLSRDEVVKNIADIRTKSLSTFPVEMNLIDLKKNAGGLSDIEYITHYILLSEEILSKKHIGKSVPELLKELSKKKNLKKVLNELADNYIFLKKLEIFNQLAYSTTSSKITDDEKRYQKLAGLLEINDGRELKRKLNSVLKVNRDSFSEIILKK